MEKTRTLVLLFALAVGSLFLGEASRALSGDVAEVFGGRGSSREARRIASPVVELSAGCHGHFATWTPGPHCGDRADCGGDSGTHFHSRD
jgi:hypothetical protein